REAKEGGHHRDGETDQPAEDPREVRIERAVDRARSDDRQLESALTGELPGELLGDRLRDRVRVGRRAAGVGAELWRVLVDERPVAAVDGDRRDVDDAANARVGDR